MYPDVTLPGCVHLPPPRTEQTHTCEDITFPQLRLTQFQRKTFLKDSTLAMIVNSAIL